MWCPNKNLGDPHGYLVGKYKPFNKQISFPASKKTLNPSAQDLKMQLEIHFLTWFNMNQNAPIFLKIVIIKYFMRKLSSNSILDLGKCPNLKTHESACFPAGPLRKIQKWIRKHFSHKVLYNHYSKKNLERFAFYLPK